MRHSKLRLRNLGMTIMIMSGLMAAMTAGAQAENLTDGGKPGLFQVLKLPLLAPGATFTGAFESHVLVLVPGRNLTILCAKGDIEEGRFISDVEALAKILFLECDALALNNETEEVAGCVLPGKMFTFLTIILPKKHEGKLYLLFEADPPAIPLGLIEFESGKGCPLPLKNEVKGSLAAELKEQEAVKHLVTFSESIQKLLGDTLKLGTFNAVLDGSAVLELTGAHTGLPFSIV